MLALEEATSSGLNLQITSMSQNPAGDAVNLSSVRVLLVEDNEVNREVALGMLETLGCQSDVAVDGREGCDRVLREKFDVILMDCHMPIMDGYEATREIRRLEKLAGVGAYLADYCQVTATAMKGDRERCIDSGMDDYVTKPIRLQALSTLLTKYTKERNAGAIPSNHAPVEISERATSSLKINRDVFNYEAALETAGGKPERLKRIVNAFMLDAPRRIEALSNALLAEDRLVAEREAHSLQGAAANLGAERCRSHAFDAEQACKTGDLPMAMKLVEILSTDLEELLRELKIIAEQESTVRDTLLIEVLAAVRSPSSGPTDKEA